MVFAGDFSGRFDADTYGSIGQSLTFNPPVGEGTCLLFTAQMA